MSTLREILTRREPPLPPVKFDFKGLNPNLKNLTFYQLQLRVFSAIFVIFTIAVMCYRAWVHIPELEATLMKVDERELATLKFAFKNICKPMEAMNYDYAVWDDTYQFINNKNDLLGKAYLDKNYLNDTFTNLKIDGIFIFDEQYKKVFSKGYHYKDGLPLLFEFMDMDRFPENKRLKPNASSDKPVPSHSGIIATRYGPAVYSSTAILRSDRSGPSAGFMVFIRLIDQAFVDEVSLYTATNIEMTLLTPKQSTAGIPDWNESITIIKLSPISELIFRNIDNKPLFKLSVHHSRGAKPSVLGIGVVTSLFSMSILLFIAYFLVSYFIIRPVQLLASNIETVHKHSNINILPENNKIIELKKVAVHFNEIMATVQSQNKLLNKQVYVDELTQITNRRGFESQLTGYCQLFSQQKIGFTLIIADVDYFKNYNDALGHLAGDEALLKIANTLKLHFRSTQDICARYGGEEFVMLYSNISDEMLDQKLAKIIDSFQQLQLPHPNSPVAPYVTMTLGVCRVTTSYDGDKPLDIVNKKIILAADQALYKAKNRGRNQYSKVVLNIEST
jgi:diguanylate cyclase (GGDEF)-like protein